MINSHRETISNPMHPFSLDLLMSTKLLFVESSPLDTTVIYETTGHPLYQIETENGAIQKTTVVRKLDLSTYNLCYCTQKKDE